MITSNLTGVVCGNSDVLLDQLIDEGVHFDLILTDPPYNINKDFGNKSDCLPLDEFIAITAERMAKIKKLLEPQGSVLWFGIHDMIHMGFMFWIILRIFPWIRIQNCQSIMRKL